MKSRPVSSSWVAWCGWKMGVDFRKWMFAAWGFQYCYVCMSIIGSFTDASLAHWLIWTLTFFRVSLQRVCVLVLLHILHTFLSLRACLWFDFPSLPYALSSHGSFAPMHACLCWWWCTYILYQPMTSIAIWIPSLRLSLRVWKDRGIRGCRNGGLEGWTSGELEAWRMEGW